MLKGYQKILAAMDVPQDLASGAAQVEITGQNTMCIGNYTGILEYSRTRLLLQCRGYRLEVIGRNLWIESYSKEELHLKGTIEETHYV